MQFVDDGPAQRKIPIRMRKDFFKYQLEAVDAFISPSLYLAGAYVRAGVPLERMHVIWYGIDVERFSKIQKLPSTGPIRFTFVGRLGVHKGTDILIRALRLVGARKVFVNLVGTGEFEPQLREMVGEYDLYSKVKFWGQVDHRNVELILRETDVLVLPSIWPENQPVTITEAMASRIPVIASDIGGIPELVVNGENGYLFQPGSEVDLAEKMVAFVDRPDRLTTFGENGFERIKDKTYEHQVDRIAQLYD
jgi:glycosyltransferase involved in cell wall biosynthesis